MKFIFYFTNYSISGTRAVLETSLALDLVGPVNFGRGVHFAIVTREDPEFAQVAGVTPQSPSWEEIMWGNNLNTRAEFSRQRSTRS